MTIYIAGKITGDPDYKEKFNSYQKMLEERGHIVLNPAVLPSEGFSYAAYMRMSAAMLRECEAVCFLPDWAESNGAMSEFKKAAKAQKVIYFVIKDRFLTSLQKLSELEIKTHMELIPSYQKILKGKAIISIDEMLKEACVK